MVKCRICRLCCIDIIIVTGFQYLESSDAHRSPTTTPILTPVPSPTRDVSLGVWVVDVELRWEQADSGIQLEKARIRIRSFKVLIPSQALVIDAVSCMTPSPPPPSLPRPSSPVPLNSIHPSYDLHEIV